MHVFAILSCKCWCFMETATTELYTYQHTLSLPDALPISSAGFSSAACGAAPPPRPSPRPTPPSSPPHKEQHDHFPHTGRRRRRRHRSEEHTSELQSLMRNSYAVFCLKNKNITNSHHIHIKNQNLNTITDFD